MNTIDKAAYEGDIVARLRNWRGLHLAHAGELFEEAAGEIERLRRICDLTPLEKEAMCSAACDDLLGCQMETIVNLCVRLGAMPDSIGSYSDVFE